MFPYGDGVDEAKLKRALPTKQAVAIEEGNYCDDARFGIGHDFDAETNIFSPDESIIVLLCCCFILNLSCMILRF